MAQQLALVALLEDKNSFPSRYIRQFTLAYNSSSKEPNTLIWPLWAPAHIYSIHSHGYTHVQINKDNYLENNKYTYY